MLVQACAKRWQRVDGIRSDRLCALRTKRARVD
jgi:hypothetical protein